MARQTEQFDERTEMPTPLRLAEARQRGVVARSGDLASIIVVLASVGLLALFGPSLLGEMKRMMVSMLDQAGRMDSPDALVATVRHAGWRIAVRLLPLLAGIAAAAMLANVVQFGPIAAWEIVQPDMSRLSLAGGLRRLFSLQSTVRACLGLAKVAAVGFAGYMAAVPLFHAGGANLEQFVQSAWRLLISAGGMLLALGVADFLYQRWQSRQDLKMTRREVLDELRKTDGDRRMQNRRERTHRDLAVRGIKAIDGPAVPAKARKHSEE